MFDQIIFLSFSPALQIHQLHAIMSLSRVVIHHPGGFVLLLLLGGRRPSIPKLSDDAQRFTSHVICCDKQLFILHSLACAKITCEWHPSSAPQMGPISPNRNVFLHLGSEKTFLSLMKRSMAFRDEITFQMASDSLSLFPVLSRTHPPSALLHLHLSLCRFCLL